MKLNRAFLIGVVSAKPSLHYLGSGTAVCEFPLTTTRTFTSSRGEQSESARHSIVVYGPHAIEVGETVKHGSCVHIDGALSTRTTTLADGRKQDAIQILAQTVQLLMPEDHHGD
jgi:single-strand DNA-binding protein